MRISPVLGVFGSMVVLACSTKVLPKYDADPPGPDSGGGDTGALVPCAIDPQVAKSAGSCVVMGLDYDCNPVTGAGCPAGKTCDFDGLRFRCLDATAAGDACASCGGNLRCNAGFSCIALESRCSRYCCDDGDCAPNTKCVMQPPTSVGLCQAQSDQRLSDFARSTAKPVAYVLPTCTNTSSSATGSCVASEGNACNPVTGSGCAAGRTCEWYSGSYQCVAGAAKKTLCEACSGPGDCAPGSSCMFGKVCARFCCDDSECGTGKCVKADGLAGVCAVPANTTTDGGGTCDLCTSTLCKDSLAACKADTTCTPCIANRSVEGCDVHPSYQALEQCRCEANTCFEHCASICP